MKKLALLVGVVMLVGAFVGGTVFAQGPAGGTRPMWSGGWMNSTEVADLLGMTPAELLAARQSGKTVLEIAKEKGVTEQQLTDAMEKTRKDALDAAVKAGTLTQAQADAMLERMTANAGQWLSASMGPRSSESGSGIRGRFGRRGGRFGMNAGAGRFNGMGGGRFGRAGAGMQGGNFGNCPFLNDSTATPNASSGASS